MGGQAYPDGTGKNFSSNSSPNHKGTQTRRKSVVCSPRRKNHPCRRYGTRRMTVSPLYQQCKKGLRTQLMENVRIGLAEPESRLDPTRRKTLKSLVSLLLLWYNNNIRRTYYRVSRRISAQPLRESRRRVGMLWLEKVNACIYCCNYWKDIIRSCAPLWIWNWVSRPGRKLYNGAKWENLRRKRVNFRNQITPLLNGVSICPRRRNLLPISIT